MIPNYYCGRISQLILQTCLLGFINGDTIPSQPLTRTIERPGSWRDEESDGDDFVNSSRCQSEISRENYIGMANVLIREFGKAGFG